jgi:hypothetical protein
MLPFLFHSSFSTMYQNAHAVNHLQRRVKNACLHPHVKGGTDISVVICGLLFHPMSKRLFILAGIPYEFFFSLVEHVAL